MSEPELQLDPAIRIWVFLPIVLITFLFGIIRHYVSVLISSPKKVDLAQVTDSQLLIRARMLRENGRWRTWPTKHLITWPPHHLTSPGHLTTSPPHHLATPHHLTTSPHPGLEKSVPAAPGGDGKFLI